jgi:hypothetical protein
MLKPIRLGKLAGELNIGIITLIKTAEKLGYNLDTNPNTKIDKLLHELLVLYFKNEPLFTALLNLIETKKSKKTEYILTTYSVLEKIRIEKGKPKTVFKYFPNNDFSKDALKNNYLFYSHFENFNDPFDCHSVLIDISYKHKKEIKRTFEKSLREALDKHGVCCFSRTIDSILMWSHYANKHEGFSIEFYCKEEPEGLNPLDVNYIEHFTKPDLINNTENTIYHLIYSKAKDWEYENELRLLKKITNNDIDSRKVNYNRKDIKSIYFGINATSEFCDEIVSIANTINKSIKFYKGYRPLDKFGINWIKYQTRE